MEIPTFDSYPKEHIATHLLLCGDSKTGKSDYAAQAILDGYWALYLDGDNGAETLNFVLKDNIEAQRRLIYIRTSKIFEFMRLFCGDPVMRWNLTQDKQFINKASANPTDLIVELRASRMPPGFLLVPDSWTAISLQAMDKAAAAESVSLESMGNAQRKVYGGANAALTAIAKSLQVIRCNVLVQAHAYRYEIKEKPPGKAVVLENEMIIKETLTVPRSSSGNHGIELVKFFNQCGWLEIDRANKHQISFKDKSGRVGGGTYKIEGDPKEYSFSKLFGPPVSFTKESLSSFCRYFYAEDFVPPTVGGQKPKESTVAPSGELPKAGAVTIQSNIPAKPAVSLSSLLNRK